MSLFRWILLVSVTGFIYIFIIPENSLYLTLFFKLLPMAIILYYAYLCRAQVNRLTVHSLILVGIIISMIGDATIVSVFLVGLTSFLVAHLFYIGAFFTRWQFSKVRLLLTIPLALYAIWIASQLATSIPESDSYMVIPVILYCVVIFFMGFSAIMTGNLWAIIGSLLFIASDSILGWNKFVFSIPGSDAWIMITYYGAQFLIAHAIGTFDEK